MIGESWGDYRTGMERLRGCDILLNIPIGGKMRVRVMSGVIAAIVLTAAGVAQQGDKQQIPREFWSPVATFSILGYDPATGEVGAAVQSRVFSVGNGVLWGEAGVGVAATQAIVDVSYGPQALSLLKRGLAPDQIVKSILDADPDP